MSEHVNNAARYFTPRPIIKSEKIIRHSTGDTMTLEEALQETSKELEHYRNLMNELSMIIGILRGSLFNFEEGMEEKQLLRLDRIDAQIERIFYAKKGDLGE